MSLQAAVCAPVATRIERLIMAVLPVEEAPDSGERPVNVDESNFVRLDASNTTWIDRPETPGSVDRRIRLGKKVEGSMGACLRAQSELSSTLASCACDSDCRSASRRGADRMFRAFGSPRTDGNIYKNLGPRQPWTRKDHS